MSLLLIAQSWSVPAWCQQPGELAVVTFNVRYDNPDDLLTWGSEKGEVAGFGFLL